MVTSETESHGSQEFVSSTISKLLEKLLKDAPKDQPIDSNIFDKEVNKLMRAADQRQMGVSYEQQESKKTATIIQKEQKHITSSMKVWNEGHKYAGTPPIEQARVKLDAALKLSKNDLDWLGEYKSAGKIQASAAAAEFVSRMSLMPTKLAEDPNTMFRMTAEFSASLSSDPSARAEEIAVLNKAILHIEDLKTKHPDKGFALDKEDVVYTLRGLVVYDVDLDNINLAHDNHLANLLEITQEKLNVRKPTSLDLEIRYLDKQASSLADGSYVETDDKGGKKTWNVDKKKLEPYLRRIDRKINELQNEFETQKNVKQDIRTSEKREVSGGIVHLDFNGLSDVERANIQTIMDLSGGAVGEGSMGRATIIELKKQLGNSVFSARGKEILQENIKNLEALLKYEEISGERLSTIYLSSQELALLKENPAVFFEMKFRRLENTDIDRENKMYEAAERRIGLAGEVFWNEQFDFEQIRTDNPEDLVDLQKLAHQMASSRERKILADYIQARSNVASAMGFLRRATDPGKFADVAKSIGDRAVAMVSSLDGALVGDYSSQFLENCEIALQKIDSNSLSRSNDALIEIARQMTIDQLGQDLRIGKYKDAWEGFFKKFQNNPNQSLPEEIQLDKATFESIARRAEFVMRLHCRLPQVISDGEAPHFAQWKLGQEHSFINAAGLEENITLAMRPRDFLVRRLGKNKGAPLKQWNFASETFAQYDPEISAEVSRIKQEYKTIFSKDLNQITSEEHEKLVKLGYIFSVNSFGEETKIDRLIKENIQNPVKCPVKTDFDKRVIDVAKKMGDKELERFLQIEEGGNRLDRKLFRTYLFLDSGWRQDAYHQKVKMGMKYGDKYDMAFKLLSKGVERFWKPQQSLEEIAHASKEFRGVLSETVDYRPQYMLRYLHRGDSKSVREWFSNRKTNQQTEYATLGEEIGAVNRRFLMINRLLIRGDENGNFPPINYKDSEKFIALCRAPDEVARTVLLSGMSLEEQGQWKIVKEVFQNQITDGIRGARQINNIEEYFTTMKSIHSCLTENSNRRLFELDNIKYDRFFINLGWEDDIPIQYMEDPTQFRHLLKNEFLEQSGLLSDDPEKKVLGLTEMIGGNDGPGSPLGRAWGDVARSVETSQKLDDTITSDEKQFMKAWTEMTKVISGYQGEDVAKEGLGWWAGAWVATTETKPGQELLANMLERSSLQKEMFGPNAKSLPVDQANELWEEFHKPLGSIEATNSLLNKRVRDMLRVSTVQIGKWNTHLSWYTLIEKTKHIPILNKIINEQTMGALDRVIPMGLRQWQSRNLMLYGVLIAAIYTGKMAEKGSADAADGKSH